MKQRFLLTFCIALIWNFSVGQIKSGNQEWFVKVVDIDNVKALEGVTVSIPNYRVLETDRFGNLKINRQVLHNGEYITFTSIGYKKLIYQITSQLPDTVKLVDSIQSLAEVQIKSKKNILLIGHLDAPKKGGYLPGSSEEIAKFIPNENHTKGTILSLNYTLLDDHLGINQPFSFSMYEKDKGNPLPGKELISDTIRIRNSKNDKTITLDISKYNIAFPDEGLFVSFKSLPINFYPKDSLVTSTGRFAKIPGIKGFFLNRRFAFADSPPQVGSYCLLRYLNNSDEDWHIFEEGIDFCIEIKVATE